MSTELRQRFRSGVQPATRHHTNGEHAHAISALALLQQPVAESGTQSLVLSTSGQCRCLKDERLPLSALFPDATQEQSAYYQVLR